MSPKEDSIWTAKTVLPVFGAILVIGVLLYFKTFSSGWTLDDYPVIVNNPDVRSLANFFKDHLPGRPLREITFLLDHAIFGMNPAGWHFQQIFWHCLNATLVFLLAGRLIGSRKAAWIAALFFLAHPIHVEVVANLSNRKDSLALAFVLLSLLAYMRGISVQRPIKWTLVATALWGVAITAKVNAVVLPAFWLAYEVAFLPSESRFALRRHVAMKALFLCTLIVMAGVFFWIKVYGSLPAYFHAMNGVMAKMNHLLTDGDVLPYFFMVLKALVFMAMRLVLPINLSPEYTFSVPGGWGDLWTVSAVGLITVYLVLLIQTYRLWPRYFFALLWVGLFWLPVSNILPLSYFAADRYLYAPSVGLALMIGFLAVDITLFKRVTQFAIICICVFFFVQTWLQTDAWRSHETLWLQAVKVNPDSTTALNNLGGIYLKSGDLEKAEHYLRKATQNFNDPMPYYNLGQVYEKMGKKEAAFKNYRYFLAFDHPRYQQLARELRQRIYHTYGVVLR